MRNRNREIGVLKPKQRLSLGVLGVGVFCLGALPLLSGQFNYVTNRGLAFVPFAIPVGALFILLAIKTGPRNRRR